MCGLFLCCTYCERRTQLGRVGTVGLACVGVERSWAGRAAAAGACVSYDDAVHVCVGVGGEEVKGFKASKCSVLCLCGGERGKGVGEAAWGGQGARI